MNFNDLSPETPYLPKDALYLYADSNSNLYFITEKKIEYLTASLERSSIGIPIARKPASTTLDQKTFFKIQKAIENAVINIDEQLPNSVKMSGNLHFIKEDKSYNLAPDSNNKKELETTFKTLLGIV